MSQRPKPPRPSAIKAFMAHFDRPAVAALVAPDLDQAVLVQAKTGAAYEVLSKAPAKVVLAAASAGLLIAAPGSGFTVYRRPPRRAGVDALAALRDAGGDPIFSAEAITAALALHRDFEAALEDRATPDALDFVAEIATPRAPRDGSRAGRVLAALDACRDDELARLCFFVVCHGEALDVAEKRLRLPPRSGRALLQVALRAMARHYSGHP